MAKSVNLMPVDRIEITTLMDNYSDLLLPSTETMKRFPLADSEGKTAALAKQVKNLGWKRALVIDGAIVNEGFLKAAKNIEGLDILPTMGANVYDILKRDTLVITKAGIEALEARLK